MSNSVTTVRPWNSQTSLERAESMILDEIAEYQARLDDRQGDTRLVIEAWRAALELVQEAVDPLRACPECGGHGQVESGELTEAPVAWDDPMIGSRPMDPVLMVCPVCKGTGAATQEKRDG